MADVLVEVHESQAFLDALLAVVLVGILLLIGDAKPDVFEDVHRIEQRAALKDVADAAAQLREHPATQERDLLPVYPDLPGIRLDQSNDVL